MDTSVDASSSELLCSARSLELPLRSPSRCIRSGTLVLPPHAPRRSPGLNRDGHHSILALAIACSCRHVCTSSWPIQLSLRGRIFAAQTRTLASRRPTLSHARGRDARQGHPGTRFVSRSCDPRFADAPMTLLPPPSTRQTIVPAVASPNAIPSPPALARPSAPSTLFTF